MKENNCFLSEKKEYIALDYVRVLAAFLVICIHVHPFLDINAVVSNFFDNVVCRIAVPFFFLTSGFFIKEKMGDKKYVIKYLKHIIQLYFIYSLFYLPQNILRYYRDHNSMPAKICSILREIFVTGTYAHLWYFIAIFWAVVFLYLLLFVFKLSERNILIIAIVFEIIGVLGNAYKNLFFDISFIRVYYEMFETTRNGIFFGFPFLFWGYWIKLHENSIREHKYWIGALFFLILSLGERAWIGYSIADGESDIMFSTVCLSIFFFLTILFIAVPENCIESGKQLRKISTLVYGFHLLVMSYFDTAMRFIGIPISSYVKICLITIITVMLSIVLLRLENVKYFGLIKKIY